jgi:hypothetical protein
MSNTGGGEKSCDKNRAGQDLQTTNGKTKSAGRVEKSFVLVLGCTVLVLGEPVLFHCL